MAAGGSRAWLRWLHRIGYVTTALVLIELLLIAGLALHAWGAERHARALAREETRTRAGPIAVPAVRYRPDAIDLLATVPPLPAGAGQGARFAISPYLSGRWFAVALSVQPGAAQARGALVGVDGEGRVRYRIGFALPAADARRFLARLEALVDKWPGDASRCLDGTGLAFELRSAAGVSSGEGNAGCNDHYRRIGGLVLGLVGPLVPAEDRPASGEWYPAGRL